MRLIMNKESFKHFSKIMVTSAKLGEDLFYECGLDDFTIKSVNDTRSMFFFTKFDKRFFEEYQLTEQIECKFKSKSSIIPFKSSANTEKNLRNLEFFVDKDKDSATFQLNFDCDDVSVFEIQYINTNLQIDLDDDPVFEHHLMAKNRSLVSLFSIFPNANDYCMMSAEADKIYFETYNFKQNEVRTKFIVKSDIFLEYKIGRKIQTTFILKPMKTFLSSMDRNASCYFYFEDDNCPIHVVIRNNLFENKFIIASIDVDRESFGEYPTGSVHMPQEIVPADLEANQNDEEINNDEEAGDENEGRSSSSYSTGESVSLVTQKDRSIRVKNERYRSIYSSSQTTADTLKEFAIEDVNDQSTQNDPPSNRPTNNSELLSPDHDQPVSQRQPNSQHISRQNSQLHNQQNSQLNNQQNSQHISQPNSQHHSQPDPQHISKQNSQTNGDALAQVESQEVDFDDIEFDHLDDFEMDNNPAAEINNHSQINNGSQTNNRTETNNNNLHGPDEHREPNGGSQIRTMAEEDLSSLEMDYDEDLLVNDSVEASIRNQKTSFDNFLNKMPSMSTSVQPNERREDELFTNFMSKHRNLLP